MRKQVEESTAAEERPEGDRDRPPSVTVKGRFVGPA